MEENEEIIVELKEAALPIELKGKTDKEIKEYVTIKKEDRTRIQQEIASLNKKRKDYVDSKTDTADNELRNALIDAIKKQGRAKNYSWK